MAPPLRSKNHVEALWKGLEAGWIDALGSDHAPHALSEKSASSVWDVKVGVPGLRNHFASYFDACKEESVILSSSGSTSSGETSRNLRFE